MTRCTCRGDFGASGHLLCRIQKHCYQLFYHLYTSRRAMVRACVVISVQGGIAAGAKPFPGAQAAGLGAVRAGRPAGRARRAHGCARAAAGLCRRALRPRYALDLKSLEKWQEYSSNIYGHNLIRTLVKGLAHVPVTILHSPLQVHSCTISWG